MMRKVFVAALASFGILSGLSQSADDVRYCGQVGMTGKFLAHHPECRHEADVSESWLNDYTRHYTEDERGGDQTIYRIPVVFHIIHNNGPENISDQQVHDAMYILNRDFRMQNEDIEAVVPAFQGITADIGIEFVLASKDPNGQCHSGINRIQSPLTTEGGSDMKELSMWPRDMYMNVWVCADAGDGTAGYTYLPSTVNGNWGAQNDGIVLRHDYTGSIGTSSLFRSRTLTHEAGHWLNLSHTWGPTNSPGDEDNCGFDDMVDDTPNTVGYTSCNLNSASCGSELDNVQNYMEYSYCSRMFTQGQRLRMRAAITSPIAERNSLITQSNLVATGVINPQLCFCGFDTYNNSTCTGQAVQFFDRSYHGIVEWTWDFGDGTVFSGTDPEIYRNPVYTYTEPGVYNVSLTVSNGTSSLTSTVNAAMTVFELGGMEAPFEEGFEGAWPNSNWVINNRNGDFTYEITPSASYTGTKSLKLRNFSNNDQSNIDELLSSVYDMSAMDTIWLSYRWAYANRISGGATEDRLRIQVSGDCGQTWNTRRTRIGTTTLPTANPTNAQFTPASTSQWGSETLLLDNQDWMTDGFRIRFEFTGEGGNNFYLEDINITASDTVTVLPVGVGEWDQDFVYAIYPNPSSSQSAIRYYSMQSERISVKLYNSVGQVVEVIADEIIPGGETIWTVERKPAGIYTVVFEKNGFRKAEKILFE